MAELSAVLETPDPLVSDPIPEVPGHCLVPAINAAAFAADNRRVGLLLEALAALASKRIT